MPDTVLQPSAPCPRCGAPREMADAGGLCVACLLGDALFPPSADDVLGRMGGYVLIEVLARGGMGVVYRARKKDPSREVALKALPGAGLLSEEARQRFRIEAEAMARLEHPGIVPVLEAGEEDGTPFFTMKLAAGGSLAECAGRYAGKWRETAELLAHIADAVHYAHDRGVLHRDLKPGNILFDGEGRAMVSDFGLAKMTGMEGDLTRTVVLMGTPNYLAPELAYGSKGSATTSSDVWSLGVIFYELLAGRPPFQCEGVGGVLRQIEEEEPPPLPRAVPRDLRVIALKALQKSPARRYGSARELADDLRRWLRGEPIHARKAAVVESLISWARRRPALAGMSAALLAVVVAAGALLWRSNVNLKAALAASDAHLRSSLKSEAEALFQSQELTARARVLAIAKELGVLGEDRVVARGLAARGLTMTGLKPGPPLPVNYANRASKTAFSADFTRYATGPVRGRTGFSVRAVGGDAEPIEFADAKEAGSSFLFSPDERWLAVKTVSSRQLRVYDLREPHVAPFVPAGQPRAVSWPVVVFAADGSHWLYAKGGAEVWRHAADAAGDSADVPVFTAPSEVVGLALSPDGRRLAVQWREAWAVLDTATWAKLWQRDERVTAVAPVWQPDGLAVGAALMAPVRFALADAETGRTLGQFLEHRGTISQAAFSPDSALLFTVGWDGQLIVWDAATALPLGRQMLAARGIGISPDGGKIAFAPEWESLQVHDLVRPRVWRSWAVPRLDHAQIYHADLDAGGRRLLTVTPSSTVVWDVEKRAMIGHLRHHIHNSVRVGLFQNPEMMWLDRAGRGAGFVLSPPSQPGAEPLEHQQTFAPGRPMARTAGGAYMLVAEEGGRAALWRAEGRAAVELPQVKGAEIMEVSPDLRLAAYRAGSELRVLRVADGQVVFSAPGALQYAARFSPDGRHLLACGADRNRVWESGAWREVASWPVAVVDGYPAVAFSPDGRHLASVLGEGRIELRDAKTWQPLVRLTAPGAAADHSGRTFLEWSADSSRVFVIVHGPRVYEWDIPLLKRELGQLGW